jgi:hypothetical protein
MIAAPYTPQERHATLVGQALKNLELGGAMTFSGGKWKTTAQVIAVLQKYFGGT